MPMLPAREQKSERAFTAILSNGHGIQIVRTANSRSVKLLNV
jgi:hypothetical protein